MYFSQNMTFDTVETEIEQSKLSLYQLNCLGILLVATI